MKPVILSLSGLALAACNMLPGSLSGAASTARMDEFIFVVEQSGCRLEQEDNADVLIPAGFTDAEAGALGGQLLADGRAVLADDGDLILLTANCL